MRVTRLASLAAFAFVISACTSISPQTSPNIVTPVTPLPATSALPSVAVPSVPTASLAPASISPSAPPSVEVPTLTPMPTTEPTSTPKPTKKPTPTPSPTPTPIAGDVEVSFLDTSIPNPFYNNTDYPITVYVNALGTQDLLNVHVKLVAKDENIQYTFDTGPIAYGDTFTHVVNVNLPAIGPSSLILTARLPNNYVDTNKANNTASVDIDVMLAP